MSYLTLPEIVEYALSNLGDAGGVVVAESSATNNLRWANSALTTNGDTQDETISIGYFHNFPNGVGCGVISGQAKTESEVLDLINQAKASALAAGPAEDAADLIAGPVHSNFNESAEVLGTDEIASLGKGLKGAFGDKSAQMFGYAEQSRDTIYVGSSSGTRMRFVQNTCRFEICAKSTTRDRSAWSGQGGTSLLQVDVAAHVAEVLRKLELQRNQIEVPPGRHNVTLTASATADLMIYLMWSAAARDAAEGRSAFSNSSGGTRVGEQLSERKISISADPTQSGIETIDHVISLGSSSMASTFDTGMEIPRVDIVKDGVLAALGSSRHAAKLANLSFTPLADNIKVLDQAGFGTVDELAARMKNGLLVTCLWYIREVDPQSLLLTGLTRDGVYVVENGKVIGASNNFRFNESPIDILSRITDAGDSVACLPREWADWFSRAQVAPLTIAEFNLSTKSDAI
jgi:predicted Zn-dependent protease